MSSSLHTHSYFSILDGFSSPEENLKRASELGLKALAITEHHELTSWPYYAELKDKYPNVKQLFGIEAYECEDREIKDPNNKYYHMIIIARNEAGRMAINRISTLGHLHGFYYKPRVTRYDVAKEGAENLIILSACLASRLSRTKDYNTCVEMVKEYKALFPYYFLEIQAHDNEQQEEYNKKIMQLARDTNTPVVVTNDVHAATQHDLYYQDYFLRIAQDKETAAEIYSGCYFMSDNEIHEVLDKQVGHDAVCECLRNTDVVADLCDSVNMPWHDPELPKIDIPAKYSNSAEYLRDLVWQGYARRGMDKWPTEQQTIYKKRIEEELYVIETKNFCDYFLIIVDYIQWCKDNNVIVGPGRGSACGSEVCYLIGITNIDSIKYDLDFGRFLTIERKDLPDIDVDISDRAKVVDYLTRKYGEDRVVQVMNIVYTSPITSIRDIGKLLGFPYKEMERISKGFVQDTWDECIKYNKKITEDPKYKELLDIAGHITNRPRGYGIHAGGVIICPKSYDHYIGIRRGQNGEHVISVDKVMDEKLSLVKLDALGIASLVAINETMQEDKIDPWEIDINNPKFEHDEAIFDLICSGRTDSLFQIESAGMKDLIARLQPRSLEMLTALVALYRPDAMPAIDGYIQGKNNPDSIHYIHPDMAQIFDKTFGQNIYQEQSMRLTKVFGGRSDAGADRMRKCLAKKKPEKVKEEVSLLHSEILNNGYSKEVADSICEELSAKGGYGFNKCVSGDTVILRIPFGKYSGFTPTVEEMYYIMNDRDYAEKNGHKYLRAKYKRFGYGSTYSLCEDGLARRNRIVDIRQSGVRDIYRLTTKTGKYIDCTANHKIPTDHGELKLEDIQVGYKVYVDGGYNKASKTYNLTDGNYELNYPSKGVCGFVTKEYSATRNFFNTKMFNKQNKMKCEVCGCEYNEHFELHHKDGNRFNNEPNNLQWLCNSCHKKAHYKMGRTKKDTKGRLVAEDEVISIEYLKTAMTYDVEVGDPYHNFLVNNGLYVCNSHAAAYAVICMQTAYLKVHHTTAFFKAMLNLNKDKAGKVNKIIIDAKQFGVEIMPPNINNSGMNFSVVSGKILFGLSAIAGIGETLAEAIIDERNAHGKFVNFKNFIARVNPTKSQIIALVKSGAIPTKNKRNFLINYFRSQYEVKEYNPVKTLPTKAQLLMQWNIDTSEYMNGKKVDKERVLDVYNAKRATIFQDEQKQKYNQYIQECEDKYLQDEEFWEFEALQIFVSDKNPFEQAYGIIEDFDTVNLGNKCVVVGIISRIQKKKTKTGKQFAFVNIYSGTGLIEATIWPEALQKYQALIVRGQQVAILGKKEGDDKVIVDKIKGYDQWLRDVQKKIKY